MTGGLRQQQVVERLARPGNAGELLLALGDNAYSSGTEQEFQDRMFTPMAPLLRKVPLFPSLGNHEYVTNQGQPYLDNFYLPANNPAGSERYYSFDWGPVHFVALDSNCAIGLASSDRCTLAAQKRWVAQDLAATRQPGTRGITYVVVGGGGRRRAGALRTGGAGRRSAEQSPWDDSIPPV